MFAIDYQIQAARTLISDAEAPVLSGQETRLLWNAMGLAGEAGEVVDALKKQVLHGHGLNTEQIVKELGDVLWYVAALCTVLDVDLDRVMRANLAKLQARYPQGWDAERSKHGGQA